MKRKNKKMFKSSKFQVVLPTEILEKSFDKAIDMGFNSVQDLVRVFLVSITKNNTNLTFKNENIEPYEEISPAYEKYLNKRLEETLKAIEDGTAYTAHNADEFMRIMDSDDE